MRFIRPVIITDAMFINSNLLEDDEAVYSAGTTYGIGDRVIVIATHRIYQSLRASNTGNHPPDNILDEDIIDDDPFWQLAGATNKWRAFDAMVGNQAEDANSLEYTIKPGVVDAIAFQNLDAVEAVVTMTDSVDGEVYRRTINFISTENIMDWWDYFFEPILKKDAAVEWDLPPYPDATITIEIDNGVSPAKCGEIIVGLQRKYGKTLSRPRAGITDYSRKTADDLGNFEVKEGPYAKRLNLDLRLLNTEIDDFNRVMARYRATPLLWVALDKYASFMVYGFYRDLQVELSFAYHSECSLEITGLT